MPMDHDAPTLAGASMGGYYHACGFFHDRDEAYRILTPFVQEGMERGEKGLHITNPMQRRDHLDRLAAAGIDADNAQHEGRLEVLTWDEAYLQGGRFDPDTMLGILEAAIRANRAAGHARTRVIGDMNWTLERKPGVEQMMEYEARVNRALAEHREPAVCMYDITTIDAQTMLDVLRTHPLVIMRDALSVNPFYLPPDKFLRQRGIH